MSHAESGTRPVPSYRTDSVVGKIDSRFLRPAAEAFSPAYNALEPVIHPIARLANEAYTAFTAEGAAGRRAQTIEMHKDQFDRDEKTGLDLLRSSLDLIRKLDAQPKPTERGTETEYANNDALDNLYERYHKWWVEKKGMLLGESWEIPHIEHLRKMTQDLMAGYLFHMNAELFRAEGKVLDTEKAKRQMKGVAAMLSGNHVHMGTGEGKSTVVLPITALVQSTTAKEGDVILSTASDQGETELKGHVERIGKHLPEALQPHIETYDFALESDQKNKHQQEDILKKMQREALLTGAYSDALNTEIRDTYWRSQMEGVMAPKRSDMADKQTAGCRILFAKERDIVFAFETDPAQFVKKVPRVLMDEADIPYRRQSPYVTTTESQYYPPEEMVDSMGEWLVSYIVSDRIRYPDKSGGGDFVPSESGFTLTEAAAARLSTLNLRNIVEGKSHHSAMKKAFRSGVREMARSLHVTRPDEVARIEAKMKRWLSDNLPSDQLAPQEEGVQVPEEERVTDMQSYVTHIATLLGMQYYQQGVGYLMGEGTDIKIRDSYIDDLLEGHRHQPDIQRAILAMSGKYAFVPPYRTAGRSVTFQTFVSSMGEKIGCASGSLLFPDLLSGKIKKEAFATFLEEATRKDVILISPPDIKKAPVPVFSKTHEEGMERLVNEVGVLDQPRLVICYDRREGDALLSRFKREYPGKNVAYVPIHPTAEQVGAYCRDLAEGKVDILISAGNLGFGVNIVKGNGEFPDLHVALFGLPENQLQVVQAFGRRRKQGNDFSWYVNERDVYRQIANFKSEATWRERVIQGELSVEQMLNGYREVLAEPEKGLVFVADLLHRQETVRRTNDVFVTYFDQTMDRLRQYAFTRLARLVREQALRPASVSPQLGDVLRQLESRSQGAVKQGLAGSLEEKRRSEWILSHLEEVVAQYGLPDEMNINMREELAVAAGAMQAQNTRDLVGTKFLSHLFNRIGRDKSIIDEYVDGWFATRQAGMEKTLKALSENYRLDRMFPVVFRKLPGELERVLSLKVPPEAEANLNQFFEPLPVQSSTLPADMTLGTFRLNGDIGLLCCRQGSQLLLLNSYQPEKRGFDWDIGRLASRVEIMPLAGTHGTSFRGLDDTYFLWTSKS